MVAIDPATGTVKQTWNVGIAPRAARLRRQQALRQQRRRPAGQAGRHHDQLLRHPGAGRPQPRHLDHRHGQRHRHRRRRRAAVGSIDVGLHPTALYRAGNALFVANTNSDTVSVIDTGKDKVVQTIATQPWPESKVGYEPDADDADQGRSPAGHPRPRQRGRRLPVRQPPQEPVSYVGLLPTDYFPADVATVGDRVVVTNTRGIDARGPALTTNKGYGVPIGSGHDTHSTTASLTQFTLPSDQQIAKYTAQVFAQNGWTHARRQAGRRAGTVASRCRSRRRIGDPSTIKHVFLIVKENRTYDQVYGDDAAGNGDPSLAQFGEKVTPNQHALAKQFGLYDNTYDIGTNSAEGHNWLMQGDNPEYTESSAGEYMRSYDTEDDVLGHQRSGFLWTARPGGGQDRHATSASSPSS